MLKKIWMLIAVILATVGLISSLNAGADAVTRAAAVSNVMAQQVLTGEWSASLVKDNSRINLNFDLRREKAGKQHFGHTFEFAELGLIREQVLSGGPVRFSLVREAGTIDCEGSFQNSKGSGTFRFTPSPNFISAMKTRGFDFEKESSLKDQFSTGERLFTAAALNVTTAQADDLKAAGFKLELEDLFKTAIFKIDSKFAREMTASGFPNLTLEDLVKARIFKIDAEFLRQASQMGFGKQSLEELVKLRIFKVTPEFIAEVRNEGLKDLSVEDLVKLRIFKIDSEFIRQAKADGIPLEVEKLVQRRIGVGRKRAI